MKLCPPIAYPVFQHRAVVDIDPETQRLMIHDAVKAVIDGEFPQPSFHPIGSSTNRKALRDLLEAASEAIRETDLSGKSSEAREIGNEPAAADATS